VHRIGRTGRAGREGDAILFVAPRERNLQRAIEKSTGVTIKPMDLPTNKIINERRVTQFKQQISDTITKTDLTFFEQLVADYCEETSVPAAKAAAALAQLVQGGRPFMLSSEEIKSLRSDGGAAQEKHKPHNKRDKRRSEEAPRALQAPEKGMERYRLEVGRINGVKPGNIVGAIANEAGIESQYMGQIQINDAHSFIDLPEGMPKAIFKDLKHTRVCGIPMRISRDNGASTVKVDRNFRAKSEDKSARRKPKDKVKKNKKQKHRAKANS
jgi:ATP-dependent RNA helicase DeaD